MKKSKFFLSALLLVMLGWEAAASDSFVVPLNRSRLVTTGPEISEAMVANPKIADIHVHGPHRLSVVGVGRGETTVRIIGKDGNVIKTVPVMVSYDLPAIRRALRQFLPHEPIGVELINTNIVLTGEVSSAASVDRAVEIVSQFVETGGQAPAAGSATASAAASAIGSAGKDPRDSIINLMQVTSGQQVMLRVRVGEIRRTELKPLGVNLQGFSNNGSASLLGATAGGLGSFVAGSGLGFGQFEVSRDNSFGIIGGVINKGDKGFGATLEALENDGLLKILAEPNLVAMSGEQAEFLAGGEIPIPVPQNSNGTGTSNITVQYKSFGVSVSFIPYVFTENRIRLNVMPEVSELSSEDSVTLNGFVIPSFTTRRAKTTVELAPGESFMIAGLIRDEMTSVLRQIPGVNEVPVLGALFRSTDFQSNETELVIAVTPYLVDPMKGNDVRMPTDNFRPASTMEMFFYGALGSIAHGERRLSQTPSLEGPIGFMVE